MYIYSSSLDHSRVILLIDNSDEYLCFFSRLQVASRDE